MERLRGTFNPITVLLLAIINLVTLSSCQNLYTFPTTIGSTGSIDKHIDYHRSTPSNTISISQETTSYLPTPTTVQPREILDSAETGFPNRRGESSHRHEEEDNDPEETEDHVIPYSVHEDARDVPTRPKYVAPGLWAKPPSDKNISLDFVPTKLHAQVRGTHTVKRLPQREAIESAETDEEKQNAHRLKEVVTNSKVNTVYTEEGYEDSAYDHAGHIRDADFHEGFARKLHNQENDKHSSQIGKKKKKKKRRRKQHNLVPDELGEYDEDYQDHLDRSIERERSSDDEHNLISKNTWEGSEMDPKLVVADGMQELENDVEQDAEEAERSERVYQRQQESRPLAEVDVDVDSSESEETHDEGDLKDEGNKPVMSKNKKSKFQKEKIGTLDKETKTPRKSKQKKRLREGSHETTILSVDSETPASPHGFVTNPLNLETYSIDQTTLQYFTPVSLTGFQQFDEPTTTNYGKLFWDYFKVSQTPPTVEPIALIPNSTTSNPQLEEQTPIVVVTIDSHDPYLLVTKEETSTLPSAFFGTRDFHPQRLFSDHVDLEPSSIQEQGRHLPGQSDVNYIDSVVATSTVATFSRVQPLLLQPLATSTENAEYSSSTTLLDDVASTPAVMTLNFTKEAYSRIDNYKTNPFLAPILDNSNIAITQTNKFKYKVLVRPTPKKTGKPTTPQPSYKQKPLSIILQEEDKNKRIRENLSDKYNKIVNYLKNKQKIKSFTGSKKIVLPEDLTLMKPPIPHQRVVYPNFLINHPIAEHSNVFVESESPRETNNWRGLSREPHRFQTATDQSYRLNPFIFLHPLKLTYRKNLLPVMKLLPPPPLPLPPPITSAHITYQNGRQHNDYLSHILGKPPQQQPRGNTLKLFPLTPEISWRSRRKRSSEDTTSETSLVVDENDENAKKKRHISQSKTRENLKESVTNSESHEELLNESPKISEDVINREIATRFNETENTEETSTESKDERNVEVEVPSFDYIGKFTKDNPRIEEIPFTITESHIDTKKYPFYNNKNLPSASALKYAVDPRTIPRKTSRGMEFYDSRNAYKQCDEVGADLSQVLPGKEEPDPERDLKENLPRLRGLGDKLDCFKAKYFDENPLDNPLFAEESVEQPKLPAELDPVKFASKVLLFPQENDDYVIHRVSKKPERQGRQWGRRNPQYEKHESIRVNYRHDPKTGRGRNAYLHTIRGSKLPNGAGRRTKNRGPKPKSPTSTPKTEQQTESYQKQVYEDVMGNIRNMANQIHEMTTLSSATQIQTAGSEDAPKVAEDTPNLSAEKNTTDIANVTNSTSMSSEIKGLMPPPKFLTPRRLASYRKYRPLGKNRISLLRAPNLPHIIAHHHTIKISKRSAAAANFSKDTSDKNKKKTVGEAMKAVNGNNTVTETTTTTTTTSSTNSTRAILDSEIEESRLIGSQDQSPLSSTLKVDKKRQTNFTSDDVKDVATSQRMVYTIRDRIRYSKPKWDTAGFGRFSSNPKTPDVDSRRKEPRYNYLARNKPVDDSRVNSTTSSTIDSNTLAIATSLTESRESGTTETHRPEDFIVHQSVYGKKIEYPEVEEAESVNDAKSEESSEEESEEDNEEKKRGEEKEEKEEEETENTTKRYRVHEDVDEDVSATTENLPSWNSSNSEEILIQKYIETDPLGYTETFSEEIKPSNKNPANTKNKLEGSDEKQDEETDHSKNIADSREDDSSEKAKKPVKMLVKRKKGNGDNESSEESSSKEEESSKNDQTLFTYTTRPSWVENDKNAEKTSYRSFPFTRYKSMIKKERSEDEDPEEESEEVEHMFPWIGDKEEDKSQRLKAANRFEYPWERRERLAKERRKRRQQLKRMRELYFGDEDDDEDEDEDEEESKRRSLYPWEKDNVPSKDHVNTRRDVLPRNTDNSEEESSNEELALKKFSSRYSAADMQSTITPSNAREISKSIKKLLNDDSDESEEEVSEETENYYASPTQKLPATIRAISRGTVPEDVTQPPRRKSGRKTPHYDKNITSSSRFDSKNLRNEDNEEGEEKEELRKDYLKLNEGNSENSKSQAEVENSQLSDITKKASSSTSAPRKKRRRIIPKNNSTFSFDSTFAESSTEATRRRRKKPQVSSTPATPPASTDLKTSKSDFAHLRKRYWTAGDVVNTNKLNSTEVIPSSTAGTTKADSVETETSTPKTRTIEHRSRVSKEKIVRKTTYPDETGNFDVARKNETFTRQEPVKKLKIKVSREKTNNKRRNNGNENSNAHEKPMKRKDEEEYYDIRLKEDNIGKLTTSEKPEVKKNENSLRRPGLRKKDVKKINDFNAFDGIVNDENDGNRLGDMIPSETHAVNYLLLNIPPRRKKDQVKTTTENNATKINEKLNEQISGKKGENMAAKQKPLLQGKFIKDPEQRLYYYVESK